MGTDAGSTGPLYGSWFLGLSESCAGCDSLDTAGLAAMLEQGVSNLRNFTKAQAGDKTMMDALIPAVDAVREAADEERSLEEALTAAARAAETGARQTENMQAAFGRARNIGQRSIGHVDPGAASMSIVFAALKEGFTDG
jgi:dihydroxyacetone kinase-like protein